MNYSINNLVDSEVELIIELTVDDFVKEQEKVIREMSSDLKINGYRPGKVPSEMAKNYLSSVEITEKAALLALEKIYRDIVQKENLAVIGSPEVEITKIVPDQGVTFKIKAAILPEIKLPDYKKLAQEVAKNDEEIKVDTKEVEETLDWLRQSRAQLKKVTERSAQNEDLLTIDYKIKLEDKVIENGEASDYKLVLGKNFLLPGFDNELKGLKIGDKKTFTLVIPNDWDNEEIKGKTVTIDVTIKDIQEKELPVADDAFAAGLGHFANLNELKQNIRDGLLIEKQEKEKQRRRLAIIDKILEQIDLTIPKILLDAEIETMLQELQGRLDEIQLSYSDYLTQIKQTDEGFRKELLPLAEKRVKTGLLLAAIAQEENITVTEEEVTAKTAEILSRIPDQNIVKNIDQEKLKDYAAELIKNEKVFKLLEN